MYRVFLSNGFDTVIDWNGKDCALLSIVFDIVACWYADVSGVTIIRLEKID